MGEKFFVWPLGGDYDCETCGPTGNEVILEQSDDGDWCLSYWVGCYGFDSVSSDEPYLVEKVEQIIAAIVSYPNFSEQDEKDLREKIERIKGDNK
jgi:hypothetical protein